MPSSLINLNGDVLAAIDVETTGLDPFNDEVVQIAIVALDVNLQPVDHFCSYIRPVEHSTSTAAETHKIPVEVLDSAPDRFTLTDSLFDWYQSLELAPGKRLIPLCHNGQFDIPFVQRAIGLDVFNEIFGFPSRDSLSLANGINDRAAFHNLPIPFPYTGLQSLCDRLGVPLDNAHDALSDALATARVYQSLLQSY